MDGCFLSSPALPPLPNKCSVVVVAVRVKVVVEAEGTNAAPLTKATAVDATSTSDMKSDLVIVNTSIVIRIRVDFSFVAG
jgi:hypothetical protein